MEIVDPKTVQIHDEEVDEQRAESVGEQRIVFPLLLEQQIANCDVRQREREQQHHELDHSEF